MTRHLLSLAGAALALGCAYQPAHYDAQLAGTTWWSATLVPTDGGTIHGSGSVVPIPTTERSRVTITVEGAAKNSVIPWDIHTGTCGEDGAIVGLARNYSPIPIGGAGSATMMIELPITLRDNTKYVLDVHDSPGRARRVACGALTPMQPVAARGAR